MNSILKTILENLADNYDHTQPYARRCREWKRLESLISEAFTRETKHGRDFMGNFKLGSEGVLFTVLSFLPGVPLGSIGISIDPNHKCVTAL